MIKTLTLSAGPFAVRVRTSVQSLIGDIDALYPNFPDRQRSAFCDFDVQVTHARWLRQWLRPQIFFEVDGMQPFKPLSASHALPVFEWGLNWCIANYPTNFIVFHAAVVEKAGGVVIMPGNPGAGKSTLTAGLVYRGWRLLSDELALLSSADGCIWPLARPISLKNESIEIIRHFAPDAWMTREFSETSKGTVTLLRAPQASIARANEPAAPRWLIFPRFVNGLPATLVKRTKAGAFMALLKICFNREMFGVGGFNRIADLVENCTCYDFHYGDLTEAVEVFDWLAKETAASA